MRHHSPGADQRPCPDRHAAHDHRTTADRSAPVHQNRGHLPIFRAGAPPPNRRTRLLVIDEDHSVTDENFILEREAFAKKAVGRNLAAGPNPHITLDLDERPDRRLGANCAPVEVHELRMMNNNSSTKLDIISNRHRTDPWRFTPR